MGRWLLKCALVLLLLSWCGAANAAKIACVGDSITFGYGLSDPDTQSYPAVLQQLLGSEHTVDNFGVSGATLLKTGDKPYYNEPRYQASDAFQPDIVIVMLGTNDSKPTNWANSGSFADDYHELIGHYRELGAVVYVATPPPVFEPGAFEISPSVVAEHVVPLVRQIASDAQAPLVDVFVALAENQSAFPDSVHPDAAGARLLAETVEAALRLHDFDGGGMPGAGGSGGNGVGGSTQLSSGGGSSVGGGGAGNGTGGGVSTSQGGMPEGTLATSAGGSTSGVAGAATGSSITTNSQSSSAMSSSSNTSSTGLATTAAETQPPRRAAGGCQLRPVRRSLPRELPASLVPLAWLGWHIRRLRARAATV